MPPYPSVRELAIDAFWELSGWDGRFATTVRALFRHPGMLTREFLEGRRARYISPLRLYLMSSLVYFLLAAAAPNVNIGSKSAAKDQSFVGAQGAGFKIGRNAPTAAERVGERATRAMESAKAKDGDPDVDFNALNTAQRDSILADINRAPTVFRPILRRAVADAKGLQRSILEAMPRMLFALLPVFAAILAVFYRRRKYPEHLYFAIHFHAFIFLALGLIEIVKFTRSSMAATAAAMFALFWIPIYSTLALKRTYGGSVVKTLAKEAGIGTIYIVATGVAFMVTLWAISVFT